MNNLPEQCRATVEAIVLNGHEMIAKGLELAPVAFLCRDNGITPVFLDFPDEQGKDISSALITMMAKKVRPEYIVFVSEAWILRTEDKSMAKRIAGQSLEHHPDRMDVVMYIVETCHGTWTGSAEIKTDDGKRSAETPTFNKPDRATGRFANFLVSAEMQ